MANEETEALKIKDLFETAPLLTGRTQIESSFGANSDDFEIDANNILNLKNKTSYWSCAGLNFKGGEAAGITKVDYYIDGTGKAYINSGCTAVAMVNLPHGAVVTGVIVYASVNTGSWFFSRADISAGTASEMATAAPNTEDTTITNGIIDNSNYAYSLTTSRATGQDIYGARITYTTDYD